MRYMLILIFSIIFCFIFSGISFAEGEDDFYVSASILENSEGTYSVGVIIVNSIGRYEVLFNKKYTTWQGADKAVEELVQKLDDSNETDGNRKRLLIRKPERKNIIIQKQLELNKENNR